MRKKFLLSFLAGAAVFISGFGAMYLFWITGDYPSGLPGLFSYYSSAIGDSVFLPVIGMGFTLFFLNSDHQLTPKQKGITAAAAAVGAFGGAALQASWLANPNIILNWTIPRTHYFNAAGWYHAAFLVLMMAFCAYSAARWLITVHSKAEHTASDHILSSVIWGTGAGFLYMYVLDNYKPSVPNYKMYMIFVVLIPFVLLFMLLMKILLPGNAKARRAYVLDTAISCTVIISVVCLISYALRLN